MGARGSSTGRIVAATGAVAGLLVVVPSEGAGAADPPIYEVTNTGFAAGLGTDVAGKFAFVVPEANQGGGTDLNGDGDMLDDVVHVYDPITNTTTNTGLAQAATERPVAVGTHVGILVPEASQGGADLNGDADALDNVAHLFDPATATATNTGLSGRLLLGAGPSEGDLSDAAAWLAFTVSEAAQGGADLNGDADTLDEVLHVYNPATATAANTMLESDQTNVATAAGLIGLLVNEPAQGGADLNGDADALDDVFHVYNPSTSSAINTMLAGFTPRVIGADFTVDVDEAAQAGADLNGDGDSTAFETVPHLLRTATATATNVGIAGNVFSESFGKIIIGVAEARQGGTDLNGDGDALDTVDHLYDPATATTTNLGVAFGGIGIGHPDGFRAFTASEASQGGTDLNGDSDATDFVHHMIDAAAGTISNTMLAGGTPLGGVGNERGVFAVSEAAQGGADLNGDGDALDDVAHIWNPTTATATNTMVDAGGFLNLGTPVDRRVAVRVREASQGATDLNGNGAATDIVLHVVDPFLNTTRNLMLAVPDLPVAYGSRLAFRVDEETQNADLNGDGDMSDKVLHSLNIKDPPVAVNDGPFVVRFGRTIIGTGLLNNDTAEKKPLTAIKATDPAHGTVTVNADGSFTYVHDGSNTTSDSFTYRANDGELTSDPATVSITVITPQVRTSYTMVPRDPTARAALAAATPVLLAGATPVTGCTASPVTSTGAPSTFVTCSAISGPHTVGISGLPAEYVVRSTRCFEGRFPLVWFNETFTVNQQSWLCSVVIDVAQAAPTTTTTTTTTTTVPPTTTTEPAATTTTTTEPPATTTAPSTTAAPTVSPTTADPGASPVAPVLPATGSNTSSSPIPLMAFGLILFGIGTVLLARR